MEPWAHAIYYASEGGGCDRWVVCATAGGGDSQSGLVSRIKVDTASKSRRFNLRKLRSPPGRELARPTTVWSAPGARVNASKTAVPRTPDAPEAHQNTEWGEHLSELACYKDLHGRRRDGTVGLIAIAPTRKSNKIFYQLYSLLSLIATFFPSLSYSTHVTIHIKYKIHLCLTPKR